MAALEREDDQFRMKAGWGNVPWPVAATEKDLAERSTNPPKDDRVLFVIEGDEPAGVVFSHTIDRRAGTFCYGVQILRAFQRQGYGGAGIRLFLEHFFGELRYQKCDVTVFDYNDASLALHASLGFIDEGRRRRATFTRGRYHDEIHLGITAEEFFGRAYMPPDDGGIRIVRRPALTDQVLEELLHAGWDDRGSQRHRRVLNRSLTWIGAYAGEKLVGYANVAWDGGVHAFLLDPTVRPDYRRKGLGTRIVKEALVAAAEANPALEWIHVDTEAALGPFYEGAGFSPCEYAGLVSAPALRGSLASA